MLFDANRLERSFFDANEFDVCVCGGGFAGITLARKLAQKGHAVALLEAGGLEFSEESQNVYVGENVGLDYFDLDVTRIRYFGGTSNHWAGWVRPLDDHNFEKKPYQNWSGWPIGKTDVDPYLTEAAQILDVPPDFEPPGEVVPLEPKTLRHIDFAFSKPPVHLSDEYLEAIRGSEKIFLFLNANLTDVALNEAVDHVVNVQVRNYSDATTFPVRAASYAICLGGLETPRLLLNCTKQASTGIGNANNLVGRFFTEHPNFRIGYAVLNEQRFSLPSRVFLGPTKDFMARHRVLGFALRFEPQPGGARGIRRSIQEMACQYPFAERIARAALGSLPDWWCDATLNIQSEQTPNPDSRVELSDQVDRFGLRRIRLDWRLSAMDFATMRAAVTEVGRQLALKDLGRVRVVDWLLDRDGPPPGTGEDQVGGHHHMCTTRMSDDPKTGVVDGNLRVFGIDNLFLCGSNVFATGGYANPTLTIVQLSLRLADHLGELLSRERPVQPN